MTKNLYEWLDNHTRKCNVCGKEIKFDVHGYGAKSHARKHIREGTAKEVRVQSTRCFAGFDFEWIVAE